MTDGPLIGTDLVDDPADQPSDPNLLDPVRRTGSEILAGLEADGILTIVPDPAPRDFTLHVQFAAADEATALAIAAEIVARVAEVNPHTWDVSSSSDWADIIPRVSA